MKTEIVATATQPDSALTTLTQATAVEQSRAIAEVQAAIVLAQQVPRDAARAYERMREECSHLALAERAFFRFPRAGETISGPSIHLARTLARCWGNVTYGVTEMSRDDASGNSEMQAWAWDVESNVRSAYTFQVPHVRYSKRGSKRLEDPRDVYENNANNGARRLREAIFAVLPTGFTADAQTICQQTIEHGGGRPLAERIAAATEIFDGLGVSVQMLEGRVGRPRGEWTANDVATLSVICTSLRQGTTTVDAEFEPVKPSGPVSVDDLTGAQS